MALLFRNLWGSSIHSFPVKRVIAHRHTLFGSDQFCFQKAIYRGALLFMGLFFLFSCSEVGVETNHRSLQVAIPTEQWFYDSSLQVLLINSSLDSLASVEGVIEFCNDFCVQVQWQGLEHAAKGVSYKRTDHQTVGTLFITQMPVVHLQVDGEIMDEPRLSGRFAMTSQKGDYVNSWMGIEWRGKTSLAFPKKSYRIELTHDSLQRNEKKVSLLNMQKDGDWLLLALYNEPLRLNNRLATKIWKEMGYEGPWLEYVEVFLNGAYQGIYALTRRMDAKLLGISNSGELYKAVGRGAPDYCELPPIQKDSTQWGGFEYLSPGSQVDWTPLYNWIDFTMHTDDETLFREYGQWIDAENLADYFHFMNVLKMADNTSKNIYLMRKHSGSPYAMVPWDMDGSFGYYWDGTFKEGVIGIHSNGLYERLLEDAAFGELLRDRWRILRETALSPVVMARWMQEEHHYLLSNGNYVRETLVWPNTVDSSLEKSLTWLYARKDYWEQFMSAPSLFDQYLQDQVWE